MSTQGSKDLEVELERLGRSHPELEMPWSEFSRLTWDEVETLIKKLPDEVKKQTRQLHDKVNPDAATKGGSTMEIPSIRKGGEILKQALSAELKNDVKQALALYKEGLQALMLGIKDLKTPKSKQAVRDLINKYMLRAEQLMEKTKAEKKAQKSQAKLPDVSDWNARLHIFKTVLTSYEHSLSEKELQELAERSEGQSLAHILITLREAMHQPLRNALLATHFLKVNDPSGQLPYLWQACQGTDKEAVCMNLLEVPAGQWKPEQVNYKHFDLVFRKQTDRDFGSSSSYNSVRNLDALAGINSVRNISRATSHITEIIHDSPELSDPNAKEAK